MLRTGISAIETLLINQSIDTNLTQSVRWRAYRRVIQHSVGWFENDLSGRIANRVTQTPKSTTGLITMALTGVTQGLVFALGGLVVLSQLNIYMSFPLLIWLLLYAALTRWTIKRIEPRSMAVSSAKSATTGAIIDGLTNIQTVKSVGDLSAELTYLKGRLITLRAKALAAQAVTTSMEIGLYTLNGALLFAVIAGGTLLWTSELISVGTLVSATLLIMWIENISEWFIRLANNIFREIGAIREGMESLSQPIDLPDAMDARPLTLRRGALSISNLTNHYGKQSGGLQDVSLQVEAGEKVALVGRSGAGKSTLLKLLLRFYDAEGGEIELDGQNIKQVTQASLRQNIGMVQQESSLLHRSVRDNITYGKTDATEEAIIAAAKQAEAHEFILSLKDSHGNTGYDALVGERGVKLSGGQRQRIALAHIIVKDAPILVLDEATSALDSEAEAAIQTSLKGLMQGKTVIAIAHRLSTIAHMDRILVMDAGSIVEEGTHKSLIAQNGLYAGFWKRQSGGFLDVAAE